MIIRILSTLFLLFSLQKAYANPFILQSIEDVDEYIALDQNNKKVYLILVSPQSCKSCDSWKEIPLYHQALSKKNAILISSDRIWRKTKKRFEQWPQELKSKIYHDNASRLIKALKALDQGELFVLKHPENIIYRGTSIKTALNYYANYEDQ